MVSRTVLCLIDRPFGNELIVAAHKSNKSMGKSVLTLELRTRRMELEVFIVTSTLNNTYHAN